MLEGFEGGRRVHVCLLFPCIVITRGGGVLPNTLKVYTTPSNYTVGKLNFSLNPIRIIQFTSLSFVCFCM